MIRRGIPADVDAIRVLMEQLEGHPFDPEYFKERYMELLSRDEYYLFVYETDRVVGMVSLLTKYPLHHKHKTSEIVEICVDEVCRSQKIGEALLEYAEAYSRQQGLEQIELCTKFTRKDAQRFYDAHDYDLERYNYTKDLMQKS